MSVQVLEREFPNGHLPLLRWLMFTGVCAFGFVLVWYYGLFRLMLVSDKTYISSIIVLLYAATCIHCLVRTVAISRESDRAHRVLSLVSQGGPHMLVAGQDVRAPDGTKLPRGHVTAHIRNLILKAGLQGGHIDQT